MDKKLDTLYDLCETVSKELETANEKIRSSGGEVSGGDIEFLERLTSTMKNLKTTIGMIEDEMMESGNSGYYGGRYYNRGSRTNMRGSSYARGGRSNARGYSRGDAREDFMDEIEELMDKAPDEMTRKKFEKLLMEMK